MNMDPLSLGVRFLMIFALGAVIGLEREINEKKASIHAKVPTATLGLRSFSLVAVLGGIVGILSFKFLPLALLIGVTFFVLLLVFYILDSLSTKDPGITTEIAMIYSFLIGLLLILNVIPTQVTLAITVVVTLLLSQKTRIKNMLQEVQKYELNAFISYAIIAVVILPFLPNTSFAFADIPGIKQILDNVGLTNNNLLALELFNPFKLWLIVALITGVDLLGYILEQTIGQKKGWLLASAVGGFVSSTATTQSLAQESKHTKAVNHLVTAAIVANAVSFIQVAFIIAPLNSGFIVRLLPILGIMLLTALGTGIFFLLRKEKKSEKAKKQSAEKKKSILDLSGALKFAGLFLIISLGTKIALELFGKSGFLIATGIGALAGLDAVMINTAQLAGKNLDYTIAGVAFLLANAINLVAKTVYSFLMGSKAFTLKFGLSMLIVILASLVGLFFI